jgi:predicted phosphodiesterase
MSDSGFVIFVGDVHGCVDELARLLAKCYGGTDERNFQVVLCGDLTCKGPSSAAVLDYCMERRARVSAIRGNWDDDVVQFIDAGREPVSRRLGKKKTDIVERVASSLGDEHKRYLRALPLLLDVNVGAGVSMIAVHAGIRDAGKLDAVIDDPEQFRDELLELRCVDKTPWAHESRFTLDDDAKHVVFGHAAGAGLQLHRHATGLDTGAVDGGYLTALVVDKRDASQRFVSVRSSTTTTTKKKANRAYYNELWEFNHETREQLIKQLQRYFLLFKRERNVRMRVKMPRWRLVAADADGGDDATHKSASLESARGGGGGT